MDLKEFINETLKQIIDGVQLAQEHAEQHGSVINPNSLHSSDKSQLWVETSAGALFVDKIEFDVALEVSDTDKISGGAGIFIGPVGLGSQGQSEAKSSSMNRIRFSVPIMLPQQKMHIN